MNNLYSIEVTGDKVAIIMSLKSNITDNRKMLVPLPVMDLLTAKQLVVAQGWYKTSTSAKKLINGEL